MKRKLISLMTALAMIMSLIGAMPITASAADTTPTIKLGDYVKMGKSGNGTLLWRCVAFEKATRQADGSIVIDSTETSNTYQAVGNNTGDTGYLPLMLANTSIATQPFDAKGENTSGSHGRGRTSNGSNYWGDSNIRDWLNSSASAGNVTWSCGNEPSYKNEAGFLTKFSDTEKAVMQTVSQKSLLAEADKNIPGASGSKVHEYNSNIADVVQNYSTARSE